MGEPGEQDERRRDDRHDQLGGDQQARPLDPVDQGAGGDLEQQAGHLAEGEQAADRQQVAVAELIRQDGDGDDVEPVTDVREGGRANQQPRLAPPEQAAVPLHPQPDRGLHEVRFLLSSLNPATTENADHIIRFVFIQNAKTSD